MGHRDLDDAKPHGRHSSSSRHRVEDHMSADTSISWRQWSPTCFFSLHHTLSRFSHLGLHEKNVC